jgi:hypothetical protein
MACAGLATSSPTAIHEVELGQLTSFKTPPAEPSGKIVVDVVQDQTPADSVPIE